VGRGTTGDLTANRTPVRRRTGPMNNDRTRFRHPLIPAFFLGRPSILYVERYRRTRDQRR
jgi:hypothetical protein